MRAERWAMLLAAGLCASCAKPQPSVYVDLDSLVESRPTASAPIESRPAEQAPTRLDLEPIKAAVLDLGDAQKRLADAKALIEQNRAQALLDLKVALFRSYERSLGRERAEREAELQSMSDAELEKAHGALRERFEQLANSRWPLANRLALLLGFPYRDPTKMAAPTEPYPLRLHTDAVNAWKKIIDLDAGFAKDAEALLAKADSEIGLRRAAYQLDFAKRLDALDIQAQAEAARALESDSAQFGTKIEGPAHLDLPSVPGRSISLPATAPPAPLRTPASNGGTADRALLEHDLGIWLAQNDYVRAKRKNGAPDKTQEFANWRKARTAGL